MNDYAAFARYNGVEIILEVFLQTGIIIALLFPVRYSQTSPSSPPSSPKKQSKKQPPPPSKSQPEPSLSKAD
jgi:hypothetical protein